MVSLPWRARIALGLCSTILAACGSGGESHDTSIQPSPLTALINGGQSSAQSRANQLKQERLTADCMKQAGWQYTPVDQLSSASVQEESADAALPAGDYGRLYGYGVMRTYELEVLPTLLAGTANANDTVDDTVDPNEDYVNALTTTERAQYLADLYGGPVDPGGNDNPPASVAVAPPAQRGCSGQAQLDTYGDQPIDDADVQARLTELLDELDDNAAVKAARRQWSACMTDARPHWTFTDQDAIFAYLEQRKAESSGQTVTEVDFDPTTGRPLDPTLESSQIWASSSDGSGHGYVIVGQPHAMSEADIDTLTTEELALYRADQTCQRSSALASAQHDAEQRLVDSLTAEFPQLKG